MSQQPILINLLVYTEHRVAYAVYSTEYGCISIKKLAPFYLFEEVLYIYMYVDR